MKNKFSAAEYISCLPEEVKSEIPNTLYLDTIYRESYEVKSSEDDEEKGFESILSTPKIDRDNEIVLSEGIDIKAFKKNPIILWMHDWKSPPVGSANKFIQNQDLLSIKVKMADTSFANDLWTLIKGKHLRTMSMGFLPTEIWKPGDENFKSWTRDNKVNSNRVKLIIAKSILLEASLVTIPSNTDAEIQSVLKSFDSSSLKLLGINLKENPTPVETKLIHRLISAPVDEEQLIKQYIQETIEILSGKI